MIALWVSMRSTAFSARQAIASCWSSSILRLELLGCPKQTRVFGMAGDNKMKRASEPEHRLVPAFDIAEDLADTALARHLQKPGEEKVAQPSPLPVASQGDGKFGAGVIGIGGKARHPERGRRRARGESDKRHLAIVIDLRESRAQTMGHLGHRYQKAAADIERCHMHEDVL